MLHAWILLASYKASKISRGRSKVRDKDGGGGGILCTILKCARALSVASFLSPELLPFGLSVGDELVPPALDGSTTPQSKAALFDIACPFFGVEETILHVS